MSFERKYKREPMPRASREAETHESHVFLAFGFCQARNESGELHTPWSYMDSVENTRERSCLYPETLRFLPERPRYPRQV